MKFKKEAAEAGFCHRLEERNNNNYDDDDNKEAGAVGVVRCTPRGPETAATDNVETNNAPPPPSLLPFYSENSWSFRQNSEQFIHSFGKSTTNSTNTRSSVVATHAVGH